MEREATEILQRQAATFRVDLAFRNDPTQNLRDFQIYQKRRVSGFASGENARSHSRSGHGLQDQLPRRRRR